MKPTTSNSIRELLRKQALLPGRQEQYERLITAARLAKKLEIGVHAGHGVDYQNILWLRNITEIEEYSIGHSIIARAVLVGMDRAVREMLQLMG